MKHNVTQNSDHLEMVPQQSVPVSDAMVSFAANENGAWYFDEPKTIVSYFRRQFTFIRGDDYRMASFFSRQSQIQSLIQKITIFYYNIDNFHT